MTSEQLRAARAMVRMDQKTLADAAGISVPTLKRLEAGNGPIATSHQNAENLRRALEVSGIIFQAEGELIDGGPGIRLQRGHTAGVDASHEIERSRPIPVRIRFARHNTGIDEYQWIVNPIGWASDCTAVPRDAIAYEPTPEEMQKVRYLPALMEMMQAHGIKFIPLTPEARKKFQLPAEGEK
jgi:transcriptional regulator with XRE-family HTH domain